MQMEQQSGVLKRHILVWDKLCLTLNYFT